MPKVDACTQCRKDGGDCCVLCGRKCDCEQCREFEILMQEMDADFQDDFWLEEEMRMLS